MFVIVQAVENLSVTEQKLPIHQRIGKAMRHAGVSITVTSVTDMAAFLIGSTSVSNGLCVLSHFALDTVALYFPTTVFSLTCSAFFHEISIQPRYFCF